MTNILCIGASTYNTGTPQKIMDAMIKTNFLQDWAVIIAIHKYLPLYEQNKELIMRLFPWKIQKE